jgi:hypothetical protein
VLHDTNYTPLFTSLDVAPRATSKTPNVFDKIEDALNSRGATLSLSPLSRSREKKTNPIVPQRVLVGGADNMENLLPKSP